MTLLIILILLFVLMLLTLLCSPSSPVQDVPGPQGDFCIDLLGPMSYKYAGVRLVVFAKYA